MEFYEKLQELRREKGITQEELAEALFVSRTAVSKWESGRGYPSIDSLKEIARYYSVTIDDLLSGEKLISLAERENKNNIRGICNLLFGVIDVLAITLIVLPLYPKEIEGFVSSVNLLSYTDASSFVRLICWALFAMLVFAGLTKILLCRLGIEKGQKTLTTGSFAVGASAVLFLILTRAPYASVCAFLLFLAKIFILLERERRTEAGA